MIEGLKEKLKKDKSLVFKVKVHAGAKINEIKEIMDDGVVKINITKAPEDGKANEELVKFFSKEFGVKKNNIKIVSGETSKNKLIKIFE